MFQSTNGISLAVKKICTNLERAVKWRIISSNPTEGLELPSAAGKKARYLDEPDAKRVLHLLQEEL